MLPHIRKRARLATSAALPDTSLGLPSSLELKIVDRPIGELHISRRNARTHSDRQIHLIAGSIRRFGFVSPILVDEQGEIIAGHGRLEAARLLGRADVPTICLQHMNEAEKRAYRIADNRLAELAGWDEEILKIEFVDLGSLDPELLDDIGFETAEIDLVIDGPTEKAPKADPADALPPVEEVAVTRQGDIWILDEHRILCGDAREASHLEALMQGEVADLVVTDPPYNVRIDGHVGGLGAVRHREFVCASGEMTKTEFVAFLTAIFGLLAKASKDGSIHFTFMDWAHLHEVLEAGHAVYDELKNIVVWNKTNGGMGSLYRSQHELVPVWKKGTAPHVNNVQLGKFGRYRTNVWTHAGVNTFRRGRMDDLAAHPTVKPVALIMDAIKDCSKPGQVVLDVFGGSGTTLIAAEKTRRKARLIEFDPVYVDLTLRRWQKLTGGTPLLAATGESFAAVAAVRAAATHPPAPAALEDEEAGHDA